MLRAVLPVLAVLVLNPARAGEVTFEQAWIRAVPPVSTTTAGYLRLHNASAETLRVTGARAAWAGHVMLHGTRQNEDGSHGMMHIDALQVAPGEVLELAPGGRHLMFTGVETVPAAGEQRRVCLQTSMGDLCHDFQVRRSAPERQR
jgi:copper(I)-binding protein